MRLLYETVMLLFLVVFTESRSSGVYRDDASRGGGEVKDPTAEEIERYCSTTLQWFKPHQKKKCREDYPRKAVKNIMTSINEGVSKALRECEKHFNDHRWNCSGLSNAQVLQDQGILKTDTRESAYVYAITSAGVSHEITEKCTKGDWDNCGCDTRMRGRSSAKGEKSWEWGGCSQNVNYGVEQSEKMLDPPKPDKKNVTYLLVKHNNEAGRRALKDNMGKNCKCHGVSGSCSVKICWKTMPSFEAVAELLRRKFDRAPRVRANSSMTKLIKLNRAKRGKRRKRKRNKPSVTDLVFTKDSPNFCRPDKKLGILGTRGRLCKKSSPNNDSCRNMCCGNGYNTIERSMKVKCNCEFIWCCKVQCELCEKDWFEHRCK